MDGQQFAKVARESRLVDKKLNLGVVGIIFLSVKDMARRAPPRALALAPRSCPRPARPPASCVGATAGLTPARVCAPTAPLQRSRKIGYEDFLQALINIADFKKVTIADIVRQILFSVPLINSVMPANVHASRPKERSPPVESSDPYSTPLAIRCACVCAAEGVRRASDVALARRQLLLRGLVPVMP